MKSVAGLDVHKDSIFLCIMQENGEKIEKKFGVATSELQMLRDVMVSAGVSEVGMESTSIYWLPVWRMLEPHMEEKLINPYFIKQLPGRKSDVKDAAWISECMDKQLVRGSYVPDEQIQQLRLYNRRIFDLDNELTRKLNKMDAALQRCNIRISNYMTRTNSKSYQNVVEALCQGIIDPDKLIKKVHGRVIYTHGMMTIKDALTGVIKQADIDTLSQLKSEIDAAERHKKQCEDNMLKICQEKFPQQLATLITIPGIQQRAATAIIAEIGVDMSHFKTANHLTSWAGLRPRNDQSNHHIMSRKITHGNKYIRQILIQCAWAASRQKNCFFSKYSYKQVQVRKKPQKVVTVAIARKLLLHIWFALNCNQSYQDYNSEQTVA